MINFFSSGLTITVHGIGWCAARSLGQVVVEIESQRSSNRTGEQLKK